MRDFSSPQSFVARHVGPRDQDISAMLDTLGCQTLAELIEKVTPKGLLNKKSYDLPPALSESELLQKAREYASQNKIFKSYLGQGYYGTVTPPVILRNVLENPAWYTAYTPYQAEISQGRMQALLNFQTMIIDLTGMDVANASLLDEGTAAAEAMSMALHLNKKPAAQVMYVSQDIFSQTRAVLETRAEFLGVLLKSFELTSEIKFDQEVFAVLVQSPGASGEVRDWTELCAMAHQSQTFVICAADLLSLTLTKPPGEMGADFVVGSTQRFGVPMGFGGPHAAYIACRETHKRLLPGRIIGVSKDTHGAPALRLALQTREQHIRREKATSNICTAQVLLAVMASMYAVYHGPEGLKQIAQTIALRAARLAKAFTLLGHEVMTRQFFDTFQVRVKNADKYIASAREIGVQFLKISETVFSISIDETTTDSDLEVLIKIFGSSSLNDSYELPMALPQIPELLKRQSKYLQQSVFNSYHSETEMLRYIHRLQSRDLSLTHSMIPLGSCTMKLNATAEMIPVTWAEFANLHPFADADQTRGYLRLISELEQFLCELTGFHGVSVQPNAGSQGEYAGLLVIRDYHRSVGQAGRNICLISSSAHGTNPASAVMAGMKVVVVQCDDQGNIDLNDLTEKAKDHAANLAALMITYPSTHGVFEETVQQICKVVHECGGQVYMDGANMNALLGLIRPADLGVDVCHMNLHKTFCIPHGGGGPGVGPIGVAAHLKRFLNTRSVSSAFYGSASLLPISWAYIRMMGADGLRHATEVAILNANYIAQKLKDHFPLLYTNERGFIAHECILDLRALKDSCNITVDDVAKRLMDYGFHAPTMSWPVAGTLMVEPTESESKGELDRFIEAMIAIRKEIQAIESGQSSRDDNLLKNAPHTTKKITSQEWPHAYSREQAAFPLPWVYENKFWPSVGRVDNAYGDRHLVCTCDF